MNDGAALNIQQRFEVIYCYKCSMPFAVPAITRKEWRIEGTGFYCPNGHYQSYCESDNEKLRKQLARATKEKEWAKQDARNNLELAERNERRRRAAQGQVTKIKNRVSKGICPCCNRTFDNLARHMNAKHPDYSIEQARGELS